MTDTGGDSLMVVDASVNSTKFNQVIEHSASVDVRLDAAGKANTTVTLDYFNNLGPWERGKDPELVSKLMVGGMYGGYVRLLTPPGSRVLSVKDKGGEVGVEAVTRENGLSSFGRYFALPRDTKQQLTFTYATPPVVQRDDSGWTYTLHLRREPGWSLPPVALSIAAPDGMRATAVSIDGETSSQSAARMTVDLDKGRRGHGALRSVGRPCGGGERDGCALTLFGRDGALRFPALTARLHRVRASITTPRV